MAEGSTSRPISTARLRYPSWPGWDEIEDAVSWEELQTGFPAAAFRYLGFLPTAELQRSLRECEALLTTHRWDEAFGNVAIEALARGVPVLSYRRGGPVEILESGASGLLVDPDHLTALVEAIGKIPTLSRERCRRSAEEKFSLDAFGDRVKSWILGALGTGSGGLKNAG